MGTARAAPNPLPIIRSRIRRRRATTTPRIVTSSAPGPLSPARSDRAGLGRALSLHLYEWGSVCAQQVTPLYGAAERNPPTLTTYDRRGERVDDITFHPAYHEIERLAYGAGIASMCNLPGFRGLPGPAAQLDKFAAMYLSQQAEGSVGCPLSMTDILARVLNRYASPDLIERATRRA